MRELDDFYFNSLYKFKENETADKFYKRINNNIKLGKLDSCIYIRLGKIRSKYHNFENFFTSFFEIQKLIQISNEYYKKIK